VPDGHVPTHEVPSKTDATSQEVHAAGPAAVQVAQLESQLWHIVPTESAVGATMLLEFELKKVPTNETFSAANSDPEMTMPSTLVTIDSKWV
jgi:hypothetical protein